MALKKRTSPAVLLLLLAVALSVPSHVAVEGNASANRQSSRRLPTRRVRGLQRDNQKNNGKWAAKLNTATKGVAGRPNRTPKNVNKPEVLKLSKLARPISKKFGELGVYPQLAARPKGGKKFSQSIGELPQSQQQAFQVKVNEESKNKATFGAPPKVIDISETRKNNKRNGNIGIRENGLEHFREGKEDKNTSISFCG